jgi:hypothetical protein
LQIEAVRLLFVLPLFEAFLNYQSLVDYISIQKSELWDRNKKTKAMVFSNINLPNDVEITFQDKLVEFVTCHNHLGITFDSNGKFHTYIVNIIKSASQRLCALRKLKYVLNRHYLSRIFLIFIRPMLEYACELWDGCSQQDSDNLIFLFLLSMLILPEFLISGLRLFQSRVVEGKKDFLVISNRQVGKT